MPYRYIKPGVYIMELEHCKQLRFILLSLTVKISYKFMSPASLPHPPSPQTQYSYLGTLRVSH